MESNIVHINFSQYKPPVFREVKSGSLVLYGKNANDLYPDYLIDLYNESTNHKACVDAKIRYTTGGGWTVDTSAMGIDEEAIYLSKLNKINDAGDSLDDLVNKISPDYQLFGSFAIEVIYNKARTKWVSLNFVPISRIRAYKTDSGKLKYVHLTDWKGVSNYDRAKELGKERDFKEWNPFGTEDNREGSELYYFRTFRPIKSGEMDVYSVPTYSASVPWVELDKRTGIFHLNNIKNNFTAGTIINLFNGDPTPEQKSEIESQIKAKFGGDNAEDTGGIMLVFNKPGSEAPVVQKLNAGDMDKMYLQVAEFARQGILTTHNIHPVLAGIPTAGALGQRNEIETAYELFHSTYVKPVQEQVFERAINHLMSFNGLEKRFKLRDVKPLGTVFSENVIVQFTPRDVMTNLIEKQLGVDFSDIQQRLSFKKDNKDEVLEYLLNCAEHYNKDEVELIGTVELNEDGYPIHSDMEFKTMRMAKVLDITLTSLDAQILSIIKSNPKVTVPDMATALKETEPKIQKSLDRLIETKAVVGELGNLKISKIADNTIKEDDVSLEIGVRYKYELADDAAPLNGQSRFFCVKLVSEGGYYTREQIDNPAIIPRSPDALNEINSVWKYRGGWYTRPEGGKTTAYCRHVWKAYRVKLKG